MSASNDGGGDGTGGGVAPRPETAQALAAAQLEAARRARANVDAAYEAARSAMMARGNGETSTVSGGGGSSGNPFAAPTLQRGGGRQVHGRGWTVPTTTRGRNVMKELSIFFPIYSRPFKITMFADNFISKVPL